MIVWHIGGDGQIGPAQAILNKANGARLVTFDARPEVGLPVCFDDKEGEADFYITKNAMASSLLRSHPAAHAEQCLWEDNNRVDVWGDITAVDRVERVRTTTVDAYVAAGHEAPDVLSIDAQGAETRILRGAEKTLANVLCVITEVEFSEIYAGQGLLDHQMTFLRGHGFRLGRLYNEQTWHPGEPKGQGFLTVAEAVWFRHERLEELGPLQLMDLTTIAASFDFVSFALKVWTMASRKIELAGGRT